MKKQLVFTLFFFIGFFLSSCDEFFDHINDNKKDGRLKKYSNQVILDWNLAALTAMGGPTYQHPLLAARINAMTHIAMHDALNTIAPAYETYAFQGKERDAAPIAAAASAAYTVLVNAVPEQKVMLDARLVQSLAGIPEGDQKTRGLDLGKEAGLAILALRENDGAFGDPIGPLAPATEPGVYQLVPPYDFVYAPFWQTMEPFSLQRPGQFRRAAQPALNSQAYSEAFNEVKTIGIKGSPVRTADQTALAHFWYELSEIGWNHIARTVVANRQPDLLTTARLFALLNIALADSYTAGWDTRFHYNFWRPYTAIRAAETDGNTNTTGNALWEPELPTPPVPDYPSTHSALGNAGATVLGHVFGDNTHFTLNSTTAVPQHVTRSFTSFSQAADENADSRVLAGIHFRFSCVAGQRLGTQVGQWVVANELKPRY
jgi:hypothetical protein